VIVAAGRVLTPFEEFTPGYVVVEEGRVAEVGRGIPPRPDQHYPDGVLIPGFVDLQVNGARGVDFLHCDASSLPRAQRYLASTGTTAFLATLVTSPPEQAEAACRVLQRAAPEAGAEVAGLHVEGPVLNPARRGAHDPRWVRAAVDPEVRDLYRGMSGFLRLVTLAPELPGAHDLVRWLLERGVVVSAGHSDATFEEAQDAFQAGVRMVTHLFNAMRPMHHREPGLAGAALQEGAWVCGIVADGVHVHPAFFRLAYRVLGAGRLALVTDAISAAGCGSGRFTLGSQEVEVGRDGAPRLADGTLAGSVLRMDQAVANAVRWGVPLLDAVRMATATPARAAGLLDRGVLRPGSRADLCVLVGHTPALVLAGGRRVWPGP
jgi:N-acetylglucosamine-6-phosphate deacetylase